MLAKKHRLTGTSAFKKVQDQGKVFQSESFGMAVLKRGDDFPSRFAFIVSTKISKDAVDRNHFKRTLSEAVRLLSSSLVNGCDVIFLAKSSITKAPASDLMREVKKALTSDELIK